MPTVSVNTFGGLDLRDDSQDVETNAAIDLLNVDFDRNGRVRARDGYANYATGASYRFLQPVAEDNSTSGILLAAKTSGTDFVKAGGVITSNAATMSGSVGIVATPAVTATYIPVGAATVVKLVSSTFSSPTGMPQADCLGVTPWDNRLVAAASSPTAGPAGAASSGAHLWFSDPGVPETWGANNYVQLNPGDGEFIRAIVPWKGQLFVFKTSRFYVFYGTSVDGTGQPVFNYRTVDLGIGAGFDKVGAGTAIAGPDGVYFSNPDGIWRTTGGPPQPISAGVTQLMPNPSVQRSSYYTGPAFTSSNGTQYRSFSLAIHQNRLYASAQEGAGVMVLDLQTGVWTIWDLAVYSMLPYTKASFLGGIVGLYLAPQAGNALGRINPGTPVTTDAGAAIASHYRMGFYDGGAPEQEKWLRQMMLSGTGTVNVKTAVNDASTLSAATSIAMGTSPAVGTGRWSWGTRGRNISVDISAVAGAWSLSHLSLDIAATRAAGVRAA